MKKPIFVGFDGFVDTLWHCVDRRVNASTFRRLVLVEQFADRIKNAAGKSANIEWLNTGQTLGGNAPLLAQTLTSLGHCVDLIGALGFPKLHPVFTPLSCRIHSIAEPGFTDALEFTNGKIMLGKIGELGTISLTTIFSRFSEKSFSKLISKTGLIATTNWTMMPAVEEFWKWLIINKHLLSQEKTLFVDLADPTKRLKKDLKNALKTLSELNHFVNVMLGLNRSECVQVYEAVYSTKAPKALEDIATAIMAKLKLHTVVIHTHHETVATSKNDTILIPVPHCSSPKRSTGAGDTFNGGFLSGVIHEKPLQTCLEWAIKASGILVRTGVHPTEQQIC